MSDLLKLEEKILTGIELGESHFREFKSAFQHKPDGSLEPRQLKDICRNIGEVLVAFANADGGELFIGVEDDGTITGIPHRAELLQAMKNAHSTYVHKETPLPPPSVRVIETKNGEILHLQVSKSSSIVHLTSEGRCLQRFDRENRPVPAETIQYDRQELVSREYDRHFVSNATIKDLDGGLLESIAQQLAPGYSPEKLLQLLDLAEYGTDGLRLRRAALLLFGREVVKWHPRCAVRIMRVNGTELGTGHEYDVSEDDTIANNIISILESAWDALKPHLARTKFQPNALFRESIIYPEDACREALINAIAHRDYSIEGKLIEILVFDDRMEVRSPGRLLSSISVAELRNLKGSHQSRNVFISRVLRELGYMREMGEGIRRIFSSVRTSELVDPELLSENNTFTVTLFYKSIFSPRDVQWLSGFADFELTKDEQRVVLLGRDGRLLSTNDIIKTIGIVDTEDFRALYEQLRLKGVIFNAKPSTTAHNKREIPRFQIRPPQEVQQYLAELQRALYSLGPTQKFDPNTARSIRSYLSPNSPYLGDPIRALRALGYISATLTPLPRATSLWTRTQVPTQVPKQVLNDTGFQEGIVDYLNDERGFGFIKTSRGETFFMHVSQLSGETQWDQIEIGSIVRFRPGEQNIVGKPKPAKGIRLLG